MRIRQWLLTGTSLAVFTFMPGAVMAQQAEYQALQDAQASGDQNAIDAAKQAFNEACIAAGYASPDECIAALNGGGGGGQAADDAQAKADAEAAAQAQADADAQAAAEAQAKAAAQAQAEADAKAAADAQAKADAEAAAQAQAEADAKAAADAQAAADAEAAAKAQAEADAKAAADAQAEADAKAAADAQAAADAKAAEEAAAKAAAEQQAAPAEQPAAEQPAAEQPAAEQPAAPAEPSAEDQQAKFVAALQAALDEYQAALNQAAGGDYAGGKAAADAAQAKILDLCTTNGYPDIKSCIGQDLPPVPEAPSATEPAAPADQPAAEQPAAETPAAPAETPAAPADQQAPGADIGPEQPAVEAPAADPAAAAQAQLQTALELYNVGIGQLDSGDASGQSTIDAANKQFADICAGLGQNDVAACLAQYGIELAPIPEVKAPAEPATPPIADLPGANEAVTPDAVEVLPEAVAPEAAAPILDSSKDVQTEIANGGAPAEAPSEPTEPAAPPPADDKAAQAAIAPVEVQSIKDTQGDAVDAAALTQADVPQNVTIINNTTVINNTVINNNNGGNTPAPAPGGNRPGKPRPDYANNGFIFNIGINLVIQSNDFDRLSNDDEDDVEYQRLSGGRIKETITRPNGVQIVTIRNRFGEVLKRSRITPDGREYILAYYNEDDEDDNDFGNWRDPGNDLPPLRLTIPIKDYILDADDSDEEDVELFFRQPPVETVREIYTIDDVKKSARLRDSVRRVEVGGLTFDSGAATIPRSQVGALSKVANAMLKLLEDNPAETFLIEGHTDAVGSDQANLILSDARATTVARILTDFYDVPAENLVTQGYGERFLKVKTLSAEPLNRRVSIKRITPLITLASK